jgi:hypothetical protein
MDQKGPSSNHRPGEMPTDTFDSLSLCRTYIDTFRQSIGALVGCDLISALERLDRAYDQFPELELDRPRRELLEDLRSTAENLPERAAIPILMYCVAAGQPCSSALGSLVEKVIKSDFQQLLPPILRLLCRRRTFCWSAIGPVIGLLSQQGRTETARQLIAEVLACIQFAKQADVCEFGEILKQLLADPHQSGIDSAMLARAAGSARSRLSRSSFDRGGLAAREALLATAERLGPTLSPARLDPHRDLAWSSGRISFNEFLLQWPCQIELPTELNDAEFIEEAYRAILLRRPEITERDQYLRLLQDGAASKYWIIEDVLASEEFRSLERKVRVISGGKVVTGPGSPEEEETPTVTWPSRSADV